LFRSEQTIETITKWQYNYFTLIRENGTLNPAPNQKTSHTPARSAVKFIFIVTLFIIICKCYHHYRVFIRTRQQ